MWDLPGPGLEPVSPALAGGFLTTAPPGKSRACSLYGVKVGVCPGVRTEGWLRCFAHPLGGAVCSGHAQRPAFAPDPLLLLQALQKWQLGFVVSVYLLSRICPNCACKQLFLVLYSFFVFCRSRRGVSRCKNCSRGAQVPACLIYTYRGILLSRKKITKQCHLQQHGWTWRALR